MTTFTTEDRIAAESVATVTIAANGNEINVTTSGEGQALFIANLMVQMVDDKIKNHNENNN